VGSLQAEREVKSAEYRKPVKLVPMKKPTLMILERIDGIPVKAGCSACKEIQFSTGTAISNMQQHQKTLEQMFREHFRTVHEREDASQV
jgi:hypothetical protein